MIGVIPERELDLVTVAPAKVPPIPAPGPGRGHVKPAAPGAASFRRAGQRTEEQLRAIAERAPEPARELDEALSGLVSLARRRWPALDREARVSLVGHLLAAVDVLEPPKTCRVVRLNTAARPPQKRI
jgi:hypothetical protein